MITLRGRRPWQSTDVGRSALGTDASKAGQVLVFNFFSEPLALSVNGCRVAEIDAWNSGQVGTQFQPAGTAILRTIDPDQRGSFFNGTNQIIVNWMGELFTFNVRIDGAQYPLVEDLALMVLRGSYALVDAFGATIASGLLEQATGVGEVEFSALPPPGDPGEQG
ncbi:hypothetical protein [Sphingomonas pituitosa]|uniref:hypothetical protein n=1 Tax=Sphingomonas pituitosa TaxID=99597 RepID=UPI00082C1E18|nr:hypothetical protein [Sphingomonas pituitosa]